MARSLPFGGSTMRRLRQSWSSVGLCSSILLALGQTAFGQTCANFDGQWEGTCSASDGSSFPFSGTIRQSDCERANVFDTMVSMSQGSQMPGSYNDHLNRKSWVMNFDWNADRTQIRMVRLEAARYGDPTSGALHTSTKAYNFKLEGANQLRLKMTEDRTAFLANFGKSVKTVTHDCLLDKQ